MARRSGRRDHERTDRVGELLREIVAGELMRVDDAELDHVSITSVDVDRELSLAKVYFTTLDDDPEVTAEVSEILGRHRGRLKKAIGEQARIRKVPDLVFVSDQGVSGGSRVEEILRELGFDDGDAPPT